MGENREFGDAVITDGKEAAINAGEFGVTDAGSDGPAANPPAGQRWVDVTHVMRFRVMGEPDAAMVGSAFNDILTELVEQGAFDVKAGSGRFAGNIEVVELVKTSAVEQGLHRG